jgi:hypothetical protein
MMGEKILGGKPVLVLFLLLFFPSALAAQQPWRKWTFDDTTDWSFEDLWQVVASRDLYEEPGSVVNFPSPDYAAYFGKVQEGQGSYEDGRRVSGRLSSPWIYVGEGGEIQPGDRVKVEFWYYREVENFNGSYDKTILEAYIFGQEGRSWDDTAKVWRKTEIGNVLFYRDARDPPEKEWQKASGTIEIPQGAIWLQLRFFFDSVDAWDNDHLGWLIDDVAVYRMPGPLVIKTEFLPPGVTGWEYWFTLEASGGTPPYIWSLGRNSRLPRGLELSRGEGTITGSPQEAGEFEVEFVVTDRSGTQASKILTLRILGGQGEPLLYARDRLWSSWQMTSLWHMATFDGSRGVWYASEAGNYDVGRSSGELTSPEIDVEDKGGRDILIEFPHYREVEYYAGGGYDKTFVQVRFKDGANWTEWQTVWYRDSKDKSGMWQLERITTLIPANARKMQIRFCFDSVDGINNSYRGWFIPVVLVGCFTGPLKIITESLPAGEVGVPYSFTLKAQGGQPPYSWSVNGLPAGLEINRETGEIWGSPRVQGTFSPTILLEDGAGMSVSKTFALTIGAKKTLFQEDFENDLSAQWQPVSGLVIGLWHRTNNVKGVKLEDYKYVAYYGKDDATQPNYDTGARTFGYLTSKEFNLDSASAFKVTFDYWREVEYSATGGFDKTYVEVRFRKTDGTLTDWVPVWYQDGAAASEKAWTPVSVGPFSVPAGATKMQIRFVFDSVDRFYNNYVGWLIDNVKVTKESAAEAKALPALLIPMAQARGEIAFLCLPNPVRDVHTATFAVRGVEAERIRVEVYELTGKLVWQGEALGHELTWHTEDLTGLPLANGLYLYRIYVKVGEGWLFSGVQKVVILR